MGDKSWFDSGVEKGLQNSGFDEAADWVDDHEIKIELAAEAGLTYSGLRHVFKECVENWDGEACMVKDPEIMADLANFNKEQHLNQEARAINEDLTMNGHEAIELHGNKFVPIP